MSRSAISAPTASAQVSPSRPARRAARAVVAAVPSTATARAAASAAAGIRPKLQQDAAGDRARGQPAQVRHVGVAAADPLGRQAGQQRPQQQRVAPGEFAAGVLERR